MKATSLKTAAALAGSLGLLAGNAMAQSSTSGVVGYETLDIVTGFNFVGVRLHENPIASGTLESASNAGPNTVTDADVDLAALITSGTYILEIEDGSGIIQEITSGSGTSLVTAADLTGLTFPVNYTLRPASTIASIFGAANESGLAAGGLGSPASADEVWFWNGAGFDQYFFDSLPDFMGTPAGWYQVGGGVVDPTTVDIIYADGFVINGKGANSVVVTGDLKSTETELNLGTGFNFVSSVGPVGMNIAVAFGAANEAGLAAGGLGSAASADEVWIWNGAGFDQYFYDSLPDFMGSPAAWYQVGGGVIDPATVSLPAGYVINGKGANDVTQGVPAFYAGL